MKRTSAGNRPISVHPKNPHYFLFRGRPTVLVTSAEHYGAVINRDFDYVRYLDALAAFDLNYTRIYPGAYFEIVDYFVKDNPLGPAKGRHVLPWARSTTAGYPLGGNKFDLDCWDPEYFDRLKHFIGEAGKRGVVVEICFFNCMYPDLWPRMPLYHTNNIQGAGTCESRDVETLRDRALLRRHEAYVAKITREVNAFDNVILEICDEPGLYGLADSEYRPWLDRMVRAVQGAERKLPRRHLIAQQVCGTMGGPGDLSNDARVQVVTGQYVWMTSGAQLGGMRLLDAAYERNKPIELNETSYYPIWYKEETRAAAVRVEAWEFIVGGGAGYNHLNALYSTANPAASQTGNEEVVKPLQHLLDFMHSFNFIKMKATYLSGPIPAGSFVRCICEHGRQYALYIHHSLLFKNERYVVQPGKYRDELALVMPAGTYRAEWVEPATGRMVRTDKVKHAGGNCKLTTPEYAVDLALRIKKA